jgi:hypothetical protein
VSTFFVTALGSTPVVFEVGVFEVGVLGAFFFAIG